MTENLIEAILFVSGDGVDVNIMRDALGVNEEEFNYAVENLKKKYSGDNGIHLITYRTKLQLCSNMEAADSITVNDEKYPAEALSELHTPGVKTIDQLCGKVGRKSKYFCKQQVYRVIHF